jgi:nucleotide-binding universal stress UspA family protein
MRVPFKTLLCPTDLSDVGNGAVPVAYRLAAPGGTVHLLHVAEPPYLGNPLYNQFVQGYMPTPDEVEAGEEKAKQRLKRLAPEGAVAAGVRTVHHVLHGVNVASVLEEQARTLGADAIVMGTHGRTGLGRILMGSVATDVVKANRVPVILVHEVAT